MLRVLMFLLVIDVGSSESSPVIEVDANSHWLGTGESFLPVLEFSVDTTSILNEARKAVRVLMEEPLRNLGPEEFSRAMGILPTEATTRQTIGVLDSLSVELPESNWIIGHRVGLRVVLGELSSAMNVASECRSDPWWCHLLKGYVLHILQDFSGAESSFNAGLEAMVPEDRCIWMANIEMLLDGAARRAFRETDCARKIELEDRIWWLADPLYLRSNNERKTEHLARTVGHRLHVEALEVIPTTCSNLHVHSVIQVGWGRWGNTYTRGGWGSSLFAHGFFPTGAATIEPLESHFTDWNLFPPPHEPTGAIPLAEYYAPPFGPIYDLDSQVAAFFRGDSAVVTAASELTGHPLVASRALEGGLILARSEQDEPRFAWGERLADRFLFRMSAPAERHLVGIELLSDDEGAARTRFGHGPPPRIPGEIALSDLLLFDWNDELPEDLDAVAHHMLGTTRIHRSREVGVFWELYGLEADVEIDISVAVESQVRQSLFRRIASGLGFGAARALVRVEWSEVGGIAGAEYVGRSLQLGIGHLPAGDYLLTVSARERGREPVDISRRVELIEG